MKCLICHSRFEHPVKRGRRARFCSDICRVKHKKAWRKVYDAQPHIKEAKRLREMARWRRDNPERVHSPESREKRRRERLARIGL
jgi:hypothetical protein